MTLPYTILVAVNTNTRLHRAVNSPTSLSYIYSSQVYAGRNSLRCTGPNYAWHPDYLIRMGDFAADTARRQTVLTGKIDLKKQ